MKKSLFFLVLGTLLFTSSLKAQTTSFTLDEISLHNTANDCYVVFEDSVYDLTSYLKLHDRYLDIRDWCGNDMTEAFKTKDGSNRDHKSSSYSLLENYKIGTLSLSPTAPLLLKMLALQIR